MSSLHGLGLYIRCCVPGGCCVTTARGCAGEFTSVRETLSREYLLRHRISCYLVHRLRGSPLWIRLTLGLRHDQT